MEVLRAGQPAPPQAAPPAAPAAPQGRSLARRGALGAGLLLALGAAGGLAYWILADAPTTPGGKPLTGRLSA